MLERASCMLRAMLYTCLVQCSVYAWSNARSSARSSVSYVLHSVFYVWPVQCSRLKWMCNHSVLYSVFAFGRFIHALKQMTHIAHADPHTSAVIYAVKQASASFVHVVHLRDTWKKIKEEVDFRISHDKCQARPFSSRAVGPSWVHISW